MVIVFVNGKGGVGKSSLCFLNGLALVQAGKSVCIEDLDPQESITSWIVPERDGFKKDGEYTLIDTRPVIDDESIHNAIRRADKVIIPASPSPGDLTALRATITVVNEFIKPTSKVFLALNMTKKNTNFTKEAKSNLEPLGVEILDTAIPDVQDIQRAVLKGWKALDAKSQTIILRQAIEIVS